MEGASLPTKPPDVEQLTPMLTVREAAAAVEWYAVNLGAREVARAASPTGQLVVELEVGGHAIAIVDENPSALNLSPTALGGTSVRLSLVVADPDSLAERLLRAGAREVFPVADQPYGMRQGRVEDPFGHHWLIGRRITRG